MANKTEAVPGRDFQILTVSFDDRDTAEIAAEKRQNYLAEIKRPFPPAAWRFLTGDAAATKRLADAVGFHFKRTGNDFIHAAAIIVIGPKGTVTHYMYGVTYLPAELQMASLEAARNEAQPTIAKFLSYCFGYDPRGRRIVVMATSAAATLTVIAAVAFVAFISRKGRGRKPGGRGARMNEHASTIEPSYLEDAGARRGLMAWLTTTDHKRIGVLYLYSVACFFLVGMGIGFLMRLVQLTPFQKLVTAQQYNALFHGPRRDHDLPVRDPRHPLRVRQLLPADSDRGSGRLVPAPQPRVLVLLHGRRDSRRAVALHREAVLRTRDGPSTPRSA